MAARRILIRHNEIEEELPLAKEILKRGIAEKPIEEGTLPEKNPLIETFNSIDKGDYGYTIISLRIMEILEVSLAVFMETSKQLENIITSDRGEGFARFRELLGNDIRFINMFSLYTACAHGIEEISAIEAELGLASDTTMAGEGAKYLTKTAVTEKDMFKPDEIKKFISNVTSSLPKKLVLDYKSYILFYRDHASPAKRLRTIKDVLGRTGAYFKVMKNSLEKVVGDSVYDVYRQSLEDTYVNVLGKVFNGFHYSLEDYGENNQLMPITIKQIIGNEEYIAAATKLARDVAGFDFKHWENPKQINPVLFALGNPGCGKTATAHAVGNYFMDFCKNLGIRSRFVIIRRTDWASSYQNASATQLIDIFKRNVLEFKGVVGIYWPDIDTAFAARGDSGLRNEEKNILGAVFGLFDGTILPKNGQWFMMCDANFMNMDKATISRITQDPYYVKGPETPEHFIKLFRDIKLRKHKEFLALNDEEWLNFGKLCIEYKLSGRSIDNMSRKAITRIEDFDYPDEYFKAPMEEKKKIIKKYSNRLTFDNIEKMTENYIEFEKGAEEKAAKKRFEERVMEITNYLSAERIARAAVLASE